MEAATVARPAGARGRAIRACSRFGRGVLDQSLNLYAGLALLYLLLPIAVIILFSFNDTAQPLQLRLAGIHAQELAGPVRGPGLDRRDEDSLKIAALATIVATILGTLMALALVRYQFRGRGADEPLHLPAARDARGRARRVAAVAVPDRSASRPGSRRS